MLFRTAKPLVVRTLVRPLHDVPSVFSTKSAELAAAREALLDRRDTADKVVDRIVDRMLKELSW